MAAEQKPIHQIIATHCTYGNNAISPRKGDLEDRAMGYSARKASVPTNKLKMWYQTIEKFFNYSLPAGTSVEAKGALDATTAPKKFLFVPSTRGFQFIGAVFYRQKDTTNRPGSYFGHVLINKLERDETSWSVAKAMQLFDWDWTQEDSVSLPELSSLSTLPAASPKSVDDKLISLFVTSDQPADFEKAPNGHLVPPRWREMTARLRRKKLRRVLRAAMESCMDKKRSALLVCEPELAILFFYAIGRLVPASILADASFSTFETDYRKRLAVQIAATTLAPEVECNTAIDEAVLRRQFVVNTFGGNDSLETAADKSAFAPYVQDVVNRLKDDGWAETEKILEAFIAAAPKNASQLTSVLVSERNVQILLGTSRQPFPEKLEPKSRDYIGRRLRDFCLEGSCSTVLARLKQDPGLLKNFLELSCVNKYYESCREVVDSLIREPPKYELPKKVAEDLVTKPLSDSLSSEFVAKIIAWRFLEKRESFAEMSVMSEMCDEVIENANSPRRQNICRLVEAIKFLKSPNNVINAEYLEKNVPLPKWHGILLALIDPKIAKLDLFGLQRKVFNWFDAKQQASFIADVSDLNDASADFRKFLITEVSKQLDRKPPDSNQIQTSTSMFYTYGHFRKQVISFTKVASYLDEHSRHNLQLAQQLVACFDKADGHKPRPNELGLQPVHLLYDKLKEIYLGEGESPDKTAVHAITILKALSGDDGRSLNGRLEVKWDNKLADRFAGRTWPPQRRKAPTVRQASPNRSTGTVVPQQGSKEEQRGCKPSPLHAQGRLVSDKSSQQEVRLNPKVKNKERNTKKLGQYAIITAIVLVVGWFNYGDARQVWISVTDPVEERAGGSPSPDDGTPTPDRVEDPLGNSAGDVGNQPQNPAENSNPDQTEEEKRKAADDAQKAADKKAADQKAADKIAAYKIAAYKIAAYKKASDKKASDKKAADEAKKKAADKKAADLASQPVVYQPTAQSNGIREEKRKDKFTPLLNDLYYHEFDLKDVSSVSPKIIAIPAADLRAQKQGWDDPGEFNVQKEEDNLWKVVRNASGLTYAYLELLPAKKQFRVYRVEVARQEGVTPFGGDNASKLDKRGDRFLSYFHLIQLNNKTYINMGLNQALEQKIGQKSAKIKMRIDGTLFTHEANKILNTMADFRLVSKPATWSITLDRIYESGIDDSKLYNAVPKIAFTGTPYISPVTASGGKYSGLKCKYTDFGMEVKFVAQTAQMQLHTRGSFESLVKLMALQAAVGVAQYSFSDAQSSAIKNKIDLTSADNARRAKGISNQFRITQELRGATAHLTQRKRALDDFIANNKTLTDLRDAPEVTVALVHYYTWVANTKALAASLTISRRQTIDGQEVEIPFWYPVRP